MGSSASSLKTESPFSQALRTDLDQEPFTRILQSETSISLCTSEDNQTAPFVAGKTIHFREAEKPKDTDLTQRLHCLPRDGLDQTLPFRISIWPKLSGPPFSTETPYQSSAIFSSEESGPCLMQVGSNLDRYRQRDQNGTDFFRSRQYAHTLLKDRPSQEHSQSRSRSVVLLSNRRQPFETFSKDEAPSIFGRSKERPSSPFLSTTLQKGHHSIDSSAKPSESSLTAGDKAFLANKDSPRQKGKPFLTKSSDGTKPSPSFEKSASLGKETSPVQQDLVIPIAIRSPEDSVQSFAVSEGSPFSSGGLHLDLPSPFKKYLEGPASFEKEESHLVFTSNASTIV